MLQGTKSSYWINQTEWTKSSIIKEFSNSNTSLLQNKHKKQSAELCHTIKKKGKQ